MIRTPFTTIVRESQDLACGLFDTQGRMIAQSISGTPGHINAMATSMKHFLAAFPRSTLAPGDVLITNDTWGGSAPAATKMQGTTQRLLSPLFPRSPPRAGKFCDQKPSGGPPRFSHGSFVIS